METLRPQSADEIAGALARCSAASQSIELGGAFSKRNMAGPITQSDVCLSTSALNRVLQYEPKDLTISVEAGMPFAALSKLLAENRQMIPLDPPYFETCTVGGVVAANSSGPRRRQFGTARDLVIGMTFATLEGKLISSGGMVVKNVAGLDMAKLMIGSFGTLAAIATVNFKLTPLPERTLTFVQRFDNSDAAFMARNALLESVLQPSAIDLLNPAAAVRAGLDGWCLIVQAGGNAGVLKRYALELPNAQLLEEAEAEPLWESIREFTPRFYHDYPSAAVIRLSSTLSGLLKIMEPASVPAVARAGTGVVYKYYEQAQSVAVLGKGAVIESASEASKHLLDLWPSPGSDFAMMEKVKLMFDPNRLLNRGRLYGRI